MDSQKRAPKKAGYYKPRKRTCPFCARDESIDYKDLAKISRYVSDKGKILPRRNTGLCAKHQRQLAVAIKRAREMALLPFVRR